MITSVDFSQSPLDATTNQPLYSIVTYADGIIEQENYPNAELMKRLQEQTLLYKIQTETANLSPWAKKYLTDYLKN